MTVKKVKVLGNDHHEETGNFRIHSPTVSCPEGKSTDVIGQGCLLTGVTSESKCKG